MVSKKIKRESLLQNKLYSRHFVLKYGITGKNFGIFFGLSRKFAKAVKRNKIKRVFRELVKEKINYLFEENNKFSVCLISKKNIKFGKDNKLIFELKYEMDELLEKLIKNIR